MNQIKSRPTFLLTRVFGLLQDKYMAFIFVIHFYLTNRVLLKQSREAACELLYYSK